MWKNTKVVWNRTKPDEFASKAGMNLFAVDTPDPAVTLELEAEQEEDEYDSEDNLPLSSCINFNQRLTRPVPIKKIIYIDLKQSAIQNLRIRKTILLHNCHTLT